MHLISEERVQYSLFKSAVDICPTDVTAAGEKPAAFLATTEMLTAE